MATKKLEEPQEQTRLIKQASGTPELRRTAALAELTEIDPEYQGYLNTLSPVKMERVARSHNRMKSGLHTVAPLTCTGPVACPFLTHCPIPDRSPSGEVIPGPASDYPMYRACVYELLYMQQKVIDYMEHLEVDPANPVEVAQVNDLAVIDLYKNRAMLVLANGDRDGDGRDFLRQDVREEQGEGGILRDVKTQIHPAADFIDRLEKRRERLLVALMETRKGKADFAVKLGGRGDDSELRQEIQAIRRALEVAAGAPQQIGTEQVLDAEEKLYIDDD